MQNFVGQITADFFQSRETFTIKIKFLCSMNTTSKIAIGLGVASAGALLAAWLLTGDRKEKTKEYISKTAGGLKNALKTEKNPFDDSDAYYYI
jgi:hypothetical protein